VQQEPSARHGHSIAVGTEVTPRPPHRSVRARLRHTAPTLGGDGKANAWPWVKDLRLREEVIGRLYHPCGGRPGRQSSPEGDRRVSDRRPGWKTMRLAPFEFMRSSRCVAKLCRLCRARHKRHYSESRIMPSIGSLPTEVRCLKGSGVSCRSRLLGIILIGATGCSGSPGAYRQDGSSLGDPHEVLSSRGSFPSMPS